ncbi:MAG: acylneuraminate cytidylyltransferase family protein [Salinivirgaceae bacterium]
MLAIIPARGGSKGLPGKNTKKLLGKPLIAYAIEAALKSKYITKVMVSTDSEEIANVAKEYGAYIPFLRPDYLATDNAKAIDNYIYTINRLSLENNISINEFVVLQPTSPLRTTEDIDNSIELFNLKNAESVISYTEEHHPISWHKYINEDKSFTSIFDSSILNRQDFKSTYYPNGAIYVFNKDLIFSKKYYSDKSYAYIMPRNRSVDIDNMDDFEYAEYLLNKIKDGKISDSL